MLLQHASKSVISKYAVAPADAGAWIQAITAFASSGGGSGIGEAPPKPPMPLPSTAVPVGAAAGGLRLKQMEQQLSVSAYLSSSSLLPGWVGVPNNSAPAGHDRWLHNWVVPVLATEVLGTSQHLQRGREGPGHALDFALARPKSQDQGLQHGSEVASQHLA